MTETERMAEGKRATARQRLDRLWHEVLWRRDNEQKITVWAIAPFGALLAIGYGRTTGLESPQKSGKKR